MSPPLTTWAAIFCAIALLAPVNTAAQTSPAERERDAVFARMLANPADRNLMLDYARLSVQMRDFEAAAATLERLIDLEPDNVAARVELAVAYFSLGAYGVAEYHLAAAAASGALTPDQAADVTRYREEARDRDAPQQFTGRVAIGQAWTREADEDGFYGTVQLDWRIDMGGPDASDWLTQLALSRYAPGDGSFSDRQIARLRSGPEFRLSGDVYGPRLQPYLELMWLRDDGSFSGDYNAVALGFAYQNPHDAYWTSYADVQIGRADPRDSFSADFDFYDIDIGVGFRPSRETRIRGTLGWRKENVDDGFSTYQTTRSLRIEALHNFDTGWQVLPRRWEARAWALFASVEEGDDSGVFNDYDDTGYGLGLRAFVTDELFVEARGARLERDFDFGFVDEETVYSLQVGWEF